MSARPHRYDASHARESRASSSLCEARTHRASSARSRLGHPRSGRSLATCVQYGWHRGTTRARTCERASSERARHGSKSADARSRAGCVRIHHLQSFAQHAVDRDPQHQDDAVSVDDRERVLGGPAERLGAGFAAVEPRVESGGALHALISCVALHPQTLVFDRHTGWGPLSLQGGPRCKYLLFCSWTRPHHNRFSCSSTLLRTHGSVGCRWLPNTLASPLCPEKRVKEAKRQRRFYAL